MSNIVGISLISDLFEDKSIKEVVSNPDEKEGNINIMALYFEDYHVGQEFVTKARTITETDIVNYAAFSWDTNPLHTDKEFARNSIFGERIAHGMLGIVVHSGLSQRLGIMEGTILAFLGMTWKFHIPIRIGDTVHVVQRVKEMHEGEKPDRGVLTFEKELINQKGEIIQTGTTTVLLKKRSFRES